MRAEDERRLLEISGGVHYSQRIEERIPAVEERTPVTDALSERVRSQRFRAGAVIVGAVAVGLILWLTLRDDGGSSTPATVSEATEAQIQDLAARVKHPIFWVGRRENVEYELNNLPSGTINVRYLPSGTDLGTSEPHLAVATYPFPNAYEALKNLKGNDIVFLKIPGGGIAEYSKRYPQSVHAAYPGVDYQVEVFDPDPGTAAGLVVSGQLAALGDLKAGSATTTTEAAPAKPEAASAAELRALPESLGHPVYWAGPRRGDTYELVQTQGGVIIRYLPPGAKVGSKKPYLSVGTYPLTDAYEVTEGLTTQENTEAIELDGGGIAAISKTYPQSIHFAYPGSDYQIEIYSPSAADARALLTSGKVRAVG